MKELQISLKNPLIILGNFDEVKTALVEGLKDYELEVTTENLSEAKKMATELNTLSKAIGRTRIDKAKEFSVPIAQFQTQAKELEDLTQTAREKLLLQIAVFEDKIRKLCEELMKVALEEAWDTLEVRQEYRIGDFSGLVRTSNITTGLALTKSARESIHGLAQRGRIAQDCVDGRLAKLEAECYKAGLEAPLQREHVERWLSESDAIYDAKLSQLVNIEVERQTRQKAAIIEQETARIRAEEQARAKIEAEIAEKKEREERAKAEAEAALNKPEIEQKPVSPPIEKLTTELTKHVPPPVSADSEEEKIPVIVTIAFQIRARPNYDPERVKAYFRKNMNPAILKDLIRLSLVRL